MTMENGKKIIILYVLNILRKYTDVNHTMTQQEIAAKSLYTLALDFADEVSVFYEKGSLPEKGG